ncbi:MAG: methyltransferase [Planctomycetota bacterium]
MSDGQEAESTEFLLDLLAGRCRAQAVSTAAALGVADGLVAGPRTCADLAEALKARAAPLERLLDLLVSLGVCTREPDQRYALTARGAALRSDAMGPLAAHLGGPEFWDPWSRLRDVLREGGATAYERTHGAELYAHLARDPDAARRYDAAIDSFTRTQAEQLCERFDFSEVSTLVDVGGGRGTALLCVLARWPHLRGILFDLPHVVAGARARIEADCPGRIDVQAGDFLEGVPAGADAYLLKGILHNWEDSRADALLTRCAETMAADGHVLVIDPILAPDDRVDAARLLDLEMLVLTGGRERRKPELRRMFRRAGLVLERVDPLVAGSWLMVGRRRS